MWICNLLFVIMEDDLFQHYLNRAYYFLKFRLRTEREMRDYLIRKKAQADLIEKIIKKLKESKFIDDKEFIKWWVDQRSSFKPKGSFVLKQELLRKGIEKDLIDNYFNSAEDDNEEGLAVKALEKKKASLGRFKGKVRYQKAVNFLLRRGFSFDVAKKAFEILWKKDRI